MTCACQACLPPPATAPHHHHYTTYLPTLSSLPVFCSHLDNYLLPPPSLHWIWIWRSVSSCTHTLPFTFAHTTCLALFPFTPFTFLACLFTFLCLCLALAHACLQHLAPFAHTTTFHTRLPVCHTPHTHIHDTHTTPLPLPCPDKWHEKDIVLVVVYGCTAVPHTPATLLPEREKEGGREEKEGYLSTTSARGLSPAYSSWRRRKEGKEEGRRTGRRRGYLTSLYLRRKTALLLQCLASLVPPASHRHMEEGVCHASPGVSASLPLLSLYICLHACLLCRKRRTHILSCYLEEK